MGTVWGLFGSEVSLMANGGGTGASKLRLREFDGETEDPQLWLRHVERVSDANQWNEVVRLRQAEASLVGAEDRGGEPIRCWPGGATVSRSVGDNQASEHILSCPQVCQVRCAVTAPLMRSEA